MYQIKLFLFSLTITLIIGVVSSSTALAEELEAPFWKVGGARLAEEEHKEISFKNKSGIESILHVTIKETSAEIRCKELKITSGLIIGSKI